MSKILALAEEIDKQFQEQDKQIKNLIDHTEALDGQLHDKDEQIKVLRNHTEYLENELDKEKTRNSEFRKDLMELLSKYSSDEWHSW